MTSVLVECRLSFQWHVPRRDPDETTMHCSVRIFIGLSLLLLLS
jgi:hypothetical protein